MTSSVNWSLFKENKIGFVMWSVRSQRDDDRQTVILLQQASQDYSLTLWNFKVTFKNTMKPRNLARYVFKTKSLTEFIGQLNWKFSQILSKKHDKFIVFKIVDGKIKLPSRHDLVLPIYGDDQCFVRSFPCDLELEALVYYSSGTLDEQFDLHLCSDLWAKAVFQMRLVKPYCIQCFPTIVHVLIASVSPGLTSLLSLEKCVKLVYLCEDRKSLMLPLEARLCGECMRNRHFRSDFPVMTGVFYHLMRRVRSILPKFKL